MFGQRSGVDAAFSHKLEHALDVVLHAAAADSEPGIIVHWFVTTLAKTPGHGPADTLAAAPILNQLQTPGGYVQVKQEWMAAHQKNPQAQLWPEVALAILGSDYQRVGKVKEAIEIFKLNLTGEWKKRPCAPVRPEGFSAA